MKRYGFRIVMLGALVILGWIAVAYAQRGSNEATTAENPLRNRTLPPSAEPVTAVPVRNQPAADSIPDASALGLAPAEDMRGQERLGSLNAATVEASAAAEPPASEGPALLVPPAMRQPVDRHVPAEVKREAKAGTKAESRPNDHYAPNRRPEPRGSAENQEPAPFQGDPFAEPAAMPPVRDANSPAARTNPPPMRALCASGTTSPDELGPGYVAPLNNALNPVEQNTPVVQNNPVSEGTGQPGAIQLEGPQNPQVSIQKAAPPEIQVGRPATFKTIIRNTGAIPASQVEVRDTIPKGTRLLSTTPKASQGTRGEILWTLGTLRPGEESAVEMELMPIAEGEIGSVATVHFGADASAKTTCTRPDLAVQTQGPGQVLIGEKINMTITVTNPGSGVASGVVLEEHIPAGLQHPAGSELEYSIGVLRPGESKKLDLQLVAAAAGPVRNLLTVRADGNLRKEDSLQMEVIAPKLDIAMEGPKRRFLEREATYQLSVSNPGTASAQGVELAAYLPPGMKFVSANNQGHYDEASRAVFWRLEQLPTRETGTVELVALPVEAGQQSIKLRGTAERVQAIEKEQPVVVEGIAAVMFQVGDSVDPIEVGGETTYEVRVVNQGSKAASNVRLSAVLPGEMQPLAADGPTRHTVQGNTVNFEGLARLAPKADAVFHIRVKGIRPGDLRTRFQLITDEMQSPVTNEESTQVYADQ